MVPIQKKLFKYTEDAKLIISLCSLSFPSARNKNIIFSVQVMLKQMWLNKQFVFVYVYEWNLSRPAKTNSVKEMMQERETI